MFSPPRLRPTSSPPFEPSPSRGDNPSMYHVGRFLQIVGLGLTGIAILEGFGGATERTIWTFGVGGLLVFYLGHWLIPKQS